MSGNATYQGWSHARWELRSAAVIFQQLACLSRVNTRMKARTFISMFLKTA
jgi:hypothetical protein